MAAGLVLATHAKADELGIPPERRAYVQGSAYAEDPVYLAEHPDLGSSPAMASGASEALACAGLGIDDVAHLDLYSCFASSVHLACDALGIGRDDWRSLTVTGGLPFAGGAGSNYVLHSIATMLEVLRGDPGAVGMVSGVGMHMTKHAFGLYSTAPPPGGCLQPSRPAPAPATIPIAETFTGSAGVASYTVAHGRHGGPEWGLVLADLPGGGRAYGRVEEPDLLHALEAEEWVGRTVHLAKGDRGVNLVTA
jgi:acetyl-CoA C-acetyltransferase